MIEVQPALLEQDINELQRKIDLVKGLVREVSLDVMDGEFVPNTTINDPEAISKLDLGDLTMSLHLMIARPQLYLKKWDLPQVTLMYVHREAAENLEQIIKLIKGMGKKVGIAINPHTPTYDVKEVLDDLDSVLIMGVEPGFAAQAFNSDVLEKIKYLRELKPELDIMVDGGVNGKTIETIKEAGASTVCANSYLFKADNLEEAIKSLQ